VLSLCKMDECPLQLTAGLDDADRPTPLPLLLLQSRGVIRRRRPGSVGGWGWCVLCQKSGKEVDRGGKKGGESLQGGPAVRTLPRGTGRGAAGLPACLASVRPSVRGSGLPSA